MEMENFLFSIIRERHISRINWIECECHGSVRCIDVWKVLFIISSDNFVSQSSGSYSKRCEIFSHLTVLNFFFLSGLNFHIIINNAIHVTHHRIVYRSKYIRSYRDFWNLKLLPDDCYLTHKQCFLFRRFSSLCTFSARLSNLQIVKHETNQ